MRRWTGTCGGRFGGKEVAEDRQPRVVRRSNGTTGTQNDFIPAVSLTRVFSTQERVSGIRMQAEAAKGLG
jgi:transcriptional regulator NrdR family protein